MNSTGMNTATSDSVIETMVNPISFEPRSAAVIAFSPCSMCRTMFSSMTIASSTTKPTDERERHERQVVEAVAEQVHRGERADDRRRQREARDDRGREVAQEEEDHQHDEHDRQHAASA